MNGSSRVQWACWAFVAVVAFGCASLKVKPPQPRVAVFDATEYAAYAGKGTGKLTGQGFMKTRGGDVKLCAGEAVYLNPVTSYSTEWFNATVAGIALEPADPRASEFIRSTLGGADGHFEFNELPAGEYYVMTTVRWEVPSSYQGGLTPQGGPVGARVSIRNGATTNVILTQ